MTVSVTIQGNAAEVLHEMQTFLSLNGKAANESKLAQFVPPSGDLATPVTPAQVAEAIKPTRGKKAPAAEVVIEQPAQADPKPEPTDGLTVDEAREHMKKFAADGHMDQVSAALKSFGVKKVSDVDPDAKGAKSAKFSEFVAKIDELVKAKVAA